MEALKRAGIVLGVALVLMLGIGLLLPSDYHVERSIEIGSKPACPFDQVNDLEKNTAWSPWRKRDGAVEVSLGEKTVGQGASYVWESMDAEGSQTGRYEIVESVPHERISTFIDLGPKGRARGEWTFERRGTETKVTWSLDGEVLGIVDRYFTLLMDGFVGPDFDEGLARIKQICEA